MYEAFFQLKRRPFASTPDPACWFHCERYQAALDELLICAEQGQGIGILVGPAGVGKTLVCERLIREIGEPFTSVLLRHATFHSRRSFLQTLLSELAQPFDKGAEQELRLALLPVLRGLGQEGRALLLVVDEAHELSEPLLEELRILSDLAEDGKPLVRLVLSGQPELEDKLAHPQLQALSQRIRAQVALSPLSTAESLDYLDYRITWAGGRLEEIIAEAALPQITRAADGIPRCLNQLCDHALLLAYVAEESPVSVDTLAHAFEDLRHLPLAWQAPASTSRQETPWQSNLELSTGSPSDEVLEFSNTAEADLEAFDEDGHDSEIPSDFVEEHLESDQFPQTFRESSDSDASALQDDQDSAAELDLNAAQIWQEEVVHDRYTALDAGLEPPPLPESVPWTDSWSEPTVTISESEIFEATAADLLSSAESIDDRFDVLQHVLQYVSEGDQDVSVAESPISPVVDSVSAEASFEEAWIEDRETAPLIGTATSVFEVGADVFAGAAPQTTPLETQPVTREKPQIRNLFTLLRRKQQGRM